MNIDYTKLTKEAKLADKCRDFNWINRQFQKGRLTIGGNRVNNGIFNQFRLAVKTTQEVHENLWDIDLELKPRQNDEGTVIGVTVNILGIIIHYPQLTIRNSENRSHDITDLFVKVFLDINGSRLRIREMHGGRMSITYAEWSSNYFHSHLSGYFQNSRDNRNAPPYWSSFCRGSGHINEFIADINSEGLTIERFTPFMIQITGLVNWESLEGGPYKRIGTISIRSNNGRIVNPGKTDAINLKELLINSHREQGKIPEIEFSLESGNYTIKDNEKFKKFLEESVELDDTQKARFLCMQDNTGQYYQWGALPVYNVPPRVRDKFIFQGRELSFSIGSAPETGDLSQIEYFVHPTIKDIIKQELEYDINVKKIRKSTIDRYSNKSGNARKSTESNKVLV